MPDSRLDSIHRRLVVLAVDHLAHEWEEPVILEALVAEAEIMGMQVELPEGLWHWAEMAQAALGEARANGTAGVLLEWAEELPEGLERLAIEEEAIVVLPDQSRSSAEFPEPMNGSVAPLRGDPMVERPEIRNFTWEERGEGENARSVQVAMEREEILTELLKACDPWPRNLGGRLVYEDFWGGCGVIETVADLFDYLKSRGVVRWHKGENFYAREEALVGCRGRAPQLTEWLDVPLEPMPPDVWLSRVWHDLPAGDGSALSWLLGRFNPDTTADRALLQAIFLTPFWGGPAGGRPLMVITGPDGVGVQASGKTTLAEMVGLLAGGLVHLHQPGRNQRDSYTSQLLARANLAARVALLDNADSVDLDEFASLVTTPNITGRAVCDPDSTRVNRLTYLITAVSPQLSSDLSSRAFVIHLRPPVQSSSWHMETTAFIEKNRRRLVADCLLHLSIAGSGVMPDLHSSSRFLPWVQRVLGGHANAQQAIDCQAERIAGLDSLSLELELFLDAVRESGEERCRVKRLTELWNDANGKTLSVTVVGKFLSQLEARGRLPRWLIRANWKSKGAPWLIDQQAARAEVMGNP